MRLIKHFSSEREDDWEKESGLVNELGEAEHPNILTYCWHCKGMYSADCFSFFGNVDFCIGLCFSGDYSGRLGKNPSARTRRGTYDIPIMCPTSHWTAEGSRLNEAV